MKFSLLLIISLVILNIDIPAQEFLPGEYEICFDSLNTGEGGQKCVNIILNEDNTYNLQLRHDNEFKTSVGTWSRQEDKLFLTPEQNSDYFDLHNDLIDKLMPERFLIIKERTMIWEDKTTGGIKKRELKKIQKCNC